MNTIWRLMRYMVRYPRWVLFSMLGMIGMVGMQFVVPWLTRYVIDVAIIDQHWHLLLPLGLAVVAAVTLRSGFVFARRYASAYLGQSVIYDLRNEMYRHLHQLPFSFYDKAQTGQLMSRVTEDVETMRRFLGFGVVNIIRCIFMFFGVLLFLLYINYQLTLLVLLTAPPLVITVRMFSGRVRPMYRELQRRFAGLNTALQENVGAVRVVRSFAREDYEIEKFDSHNRGYMTQNVATVRNWAFFFPAMRTISEVGTIIILWYGGRQVIIGVMTLGWLVAYNQYLTMLLGPLRMMGWLVNLTERAIASGQRVFAVLDTESEMEEKEDAVELESVEGHIQIEDLWFRYDEHGKWILCGINLEVEPGHRVALLGATGSGKTTLINMLPRFYDPSRGRVILDGCDLRDVTINSLRTNIGMVMQDTFLFSAPIRENIAYGRPGADLEAVKTAARAAQIHDFIEDLPEGYDTLVGERGVGLSGGQKQRVAIARALLLDPPILILDDSTSSVDAETEHLLRAALDTLMKGRTTFIITQRLSSIRDADTIMVLDGGQVVQRGRHEDLVSHAGIYREIHELQSKDQDEISEELFERARERAIAGAQEKVGGV